MSTGSDELSRNPSRKGFLPVVDFHPGIIQTVGNDSSLPPAAQMVPKNDLPTRVDFPAPRMIVQLELMLIQKTVQTLPYTGACSHYINPISVEFSGNGCKK